MSWALRGGMRLLRKPPRFCLRVVSIHSGKSGTGERNAWDEARRVHLCKRCGKPSSPLIHAPSTAPFPAEM
ncbi:hypothetical protein OBV_31060 [Oscillibacter valericigenes Sjm18-20]|nr:hypothetical protein OBV_31060 [Oscillibacter valericigenes Sjm18-20]